MKDKNNANLDLAYQYCRNITKTYAKTFYFSSVFLPKEKRNAAYAVYAFCRYMDDLVDNSISTGKGIKSLTKEDIIKVIEIWRENLKYIYKGGTIDNPIMIAWKDTLTKFNIKEELPNELIDGVYMDLTTKRYDSFDELRDYCYKVASVVGLMSAEIFGYNNSGALDYAVDLGIAMQLTNILRDIKEDAERNRIYLPSEDLEKFSYNEEDLMNGKINDNFRELMKFQIERADFYYEKANTGIKMLDKDSQMTVGLMSDNYRNILNVIRNNNFDIYSSRASVTTFQKIINIPKVYFSLTSKSESD